MSIPLNLTNEGDWTVIAARPSSMPLRGPVLAIVLPGFFCSVLIANGAARVGLPLWLLISGLIFAWLWHVNRNKRHGHLGSFAVKSDAVRLPDGQVVAVNRLDRLGVRNTESGASHIYGGNLGQTGAAMTHERMIKISYAVVAEHDGMLSFLAGGLTQPLADAVLKETVRRLDGFAMR